MALPGGVSVLALVSVVIIAVGVLLHIVGLATPEWSALHKDGNYGTVGLWKVCTKDNVKGEKCDDVSTLSVSLGGDFYDSVKACEAFAIIGMLASFVGLALAGLYIILPMLGKDKNPMFPMITVAACAASFVCVLIAIIVWGAKTHTDFLKKLQLEIAYSFILSIIGGLLIGVGGVLALVADKFVS